MEAALDTVRTAATVAVGMEVFRKHIQQVSTDRLPHRTWNSIIRVNRAMHIILKCNRAQVQWNTRVLRARKSRRKSWTRRFDAHWWRIHAKRHAKKATNSRLAKLFWMSSVMLANGHWKNTNGAINCRVNVSLTDFFMYWFRNYFVSSPNFAALCVPECRNNGICIQPGQCSCADNFVGPYCEHEKKLCLSKPPVPKNSKVSCSSTSCTITCAQGHQFPDASSITNMVCKQGVWAPSRLELATIPDCQRK